MFYYQVPEFNYAVVFGVMLGIYIISTIEAMVTKAMVFAKGWCS